MHLDDKYFTSVSQNISVTFLLLVLYLVQRKKKVDSICVFQMSEVFEQAQGSSWSSLSFRASTPSPWKEAST